MTSSDVAWLSGLVGINLTDNPNGGMAESSHELTQSTAARLSDLAQATEQVNNFLKILYFQVDYNFFLHFYRVIFSGVKFCNMTPKRQIMRMTLMRSYYMHMADNFTTFQIHENIFFSYVI